MKWNHIKILLIILLIIVNAFFAVTLFIQYRTANYIPDSELDSLTTLLSGGNVQIAEGALPAKKQDSTFYGGDYPRDPSGYYETTANRLSGGFYEATVNMPSGEKISKSYVNPNGMNFVMRDGGETYEYEFTYPFGIKYVYRGKGTDDYVIDENSAAVAALPKVDIIRAFYTMNTIRRFLYAGDKQNGDTSGGLRIRLEADSVRYDASKYCYIAEVTQYAGSQPINGCSALIAVNGNKVVYVSGNLILCSLSESYPAELRDQVNLMLAEKRELSQTGEVNSDTAETTADTNAVDSPPAESDLIYTLTSAKSCYCLFLDNDRAKFYLVPGWNFTYNGAITRIRDAVKGSIYTK